MSKKYTILGIESSCDDTGVSIISTDGNSFKILFEKTASQIDIHKQYGGVIPEVAGRLHCEAIAPLLEEALSSVANIDAIAVTAMPGLITGLHVGVEAAKTLSYTKDIPLVGVHHIEGHIMSPLLNKGAAIDAVSFPLLALVVSGGHTQLVHVHEFGSYSVIGDTRDDAAGECFDKVGKLMGFIYPGGPKVSKAAIGHEDNIPLPRPMMHHDSLDFSFSGLKTAARYYLRDNPNADVGDVSASLEAAIVETLAYKTKKAAMQIGAKTVFVVGGVSANSALRESLATSLETQHIALIAPELAHCTDNAAMIACAATRRVMHGSFDSVSELTASPVGMLPQ
ncbi:MAG: tRNA (adenosine(37)-N6)-threonylcarbamoyltransferase complex transferase subunit TsaD [Candidatus Magasanikbacteria bacterium]|jgi:N6-L-threonylcarbamoyladenine synthase|nr:tRNA (adenosine(37)-N6)-threonylcarbamoyltransferase complex transferase subunit TsaD [Candidatus Magasanikbacteria bacterium]